MRTGHTDFSKSLEQLNGWGPSDPTLAETPLVADVMRASKKPLNQLSDYEIGMLVVQQYGYPYLLDLVWPKIEADPLFDGGYYPGDVLSNLETDFQTFTRVHLPDRSMNVTRFGKACSFLMKPFARTERPLTTPLVMLEFICLHRMVALRPLFDPVDPHGPIRAA